MPKRVKKGASDERSHQNSLDSQSLSASPAASPDTSINPESTADDEDDPSSSGSLHAAPAGNDITSEDAFNTSTAAVSASASSVSYLKQERKAVHNALERKRRDHIKDMFVQLRFVVPTIEKDKASRAEILRKSTDFINQMRRKNDSTRQDIALMKRSVDALEAQLNLLEQTNGDAIPMTSDDAVTNASSDYAELTKASNKRQRSLSPAVE